jgi:hypothetical protein
MPGDWWRLPDLHADHWDMNPGCYFTLQRSARSWNRTKLPALMRGSGRHDHLANCGDCRDRTGHPLLAKQTLYQMS